MDFLVYLENMIIALLAFMSNYEMIFLVFTYIFIRVLVGTILCDVLDERRDSFSGIALYL